MPISQKAFEDAERELCYIVVTNAHDAAMRDAFDMIFNDALRQAKEAVLRLNKPWARAYMDTEVIDAIDSLKVKS